MENSNRITLPACLTWSMCRCDVHKYECTWLWMWERSISLSQAIPKIMVFFPYKLHTDIGFGTNICGECNNKVCKVHPIFFRHGRAVLTGRGRQQNDDGLVRDRMKGMLNKRNSIFVRRNSVVPLAMNWHRSFMAISFRMGPNGYHLKSRPSHIFRSPHFPWIPYSLYYTLTGILILFGRYFYHIPFPNIQIHSYFYVNNKKYHCQWNKLNEHILFLFIRCHHMICSHKYCMNICATAFRKT